jgi:hypothetical protein
MFYHAVQHIKPVGKKLKWGAFAQTDARFIPEKKVVVFTMGYYANMKSLAISTVLIVVSILFSLGATSVLFKEQ